MSDLRRSPKAMAALVAAGAVLLFAAAWFLLVAPQRSKASELAADVTTARGDLAKRKLALAHPSAPVTVKSSDLYRLTKALPDEADMPGVLLDVSRLAKTNGLEFSKITPSAQVQGTSYLQQPLAVEVVGRFGSVSHFLGDLRSLVGVRGSRLDARGRLYTVTAIDISAPNPPKVYPVVKAAVTLNAYSFTTPAPTTTTSPSTTTDASSSGTVAAGANP